MIGLGYKNDLVVSHHTPQGFYLSDEEGTEILLPNKEVPEACQPGDRLTVFCYLDHDERPVASLKAPFIERDQLAVLTVAECSSVGYFLDWGLEKQLLLPFRESNKTHQVGDKVLVICIIDEHSSRLMASERIEKKCKPDLNVFRQGIAYSAYVYRETPMGYELFTREGLKGLLFRDRTAVDLKPLEELKVFIDRKRPDGKIDFALQLKGEDKFHQAKERILDQLENQEGFIALNDKSSTEMIFEQLQMSKKTFKATIGILLKEKRIVFEDNGIRLVVN